MRAAKAAQVRAIRLYDVRHTHATLLLPAGVEPVIFELGPGGGPSVRLRGSTFTADPNSALGAKVSDDSEVKRQDGSLPGVLPESRVSQHQEKPDGRRGRRSR